MGLSAVGEAQPRCCLGFCDAGTVGLTRQTEGQAWLSPRNVSWRWGGSRAGREGGGQPGRLVGEAGGDGGSVSLRVGLLENTA